MKPWLIEVNMCPSLRLGTIIDKKVKIPLLCDIMNIIGFIPKHFNKQLKQNKKMKTFY